MSEPELSIDPTEARRRRVPRVWPWALLLALLAGGLGYYLWSRGRPTAPAPPEPVAPAAETQPDDAPPPAPPRVDLPSLEASDPWMREVVAQLSAHPALLRWLATDELVRRFVAAVDNVAEGRSPRPHIGFLQPAEGFQVRQEGGRLTVDGESYRRYDPVVNVIDSLDVRGTTELYRSVRPLLNQAYDDLGYPDRSFDATLARAIDELLATPVPSGAPVLERDVTAFTYADPRLEGLSDAQKHFLRLGPDNLLRLQAKARRLATEIGLPIRP